MQPAERKDEQSKQQKHHQPRNKTRYALSKGNKWYSIKNLYMFLARFHARSEVWMFISSPVYLYPAVALPGMHTW